MTDLRVWIGCESAYSDGKLHGQWVDIGEMQNPRIDVQNAIKSILETSPAQSEEWGIFDIEADFDHCSSDSLDELIERLELCNEWGEDAIYALSMADGDVERAKQIIDNGMYYANSLEEIGEQLVECELDETNWLNGYLDYEAIGRDHLTSCYYAPDGNGGYYYTYQF